MISRKGKPDTDADIALRENLASDHPRSFVVIAGAGSGKTTSLVKALDVVVELRGETMRRQSQQVACITYTEVATEEIAKDVGHPDLVHVSTIHSFLWLLIRPFSVDITEWVSARITAKIEERNQKITNPRSHTATKVKATVEVETLQKQLETIKVVRRWSYGTGSDYGRGILGHADIIALVPNLILQHSLLATMVARRFPYVFVDESQDTFPDVVRALQSIADGAHGDFCVGFFGDPMQQIYTTGVGSIELGANWLQVQKPQNYRSSKQVLELVNRIRSQSDGLHQASGLPENKEGSANVYILLADEKREERLQSLLTQLQTSTGKMAEEPRVLVIVHRMAADRLGFGGLYSAGNDDAPPSVKAAITEGNYWVLRPILKYLLPLVTAQMAGRDSEVMTLVRGNSPILSPESTITTGIHIRLENLAVAVEHLAELFETGSTATISDVLNAAQDSNLLILDPRFNTFLSIGLARNDDDSLAVEEKEENETIARILACPAVEVRAYGEYLDGRSPFSTQHGVKGSEFPSVVVVIDDEEGYFSLYSYEKLFGLKELSEKDQENISGGEDSVIDRTRRLFYVCCSRAEEHLAVAIFTKDPDATVTKLKESGLWDPSNVILFEGSETINL